MEHFFEFVKKEDSEVVFNSEDYATSKRLIKIRMKAFIAQNLFSSKEMYQIFNTQNEILNKAIQLLQTKEYNSFNLDN